MQTIPSGNRYVIAEYDIIGIWNYAIKLPCGGKVLLFFCSPTMRRNFKLPYRNILIICMLFGKEWNLLNGKVSALWN